MRTFVIEMERGATLRKLAEVVGEERHFLLDAPCTHEGCIQITERDSHPRPLPVIAGFSMLIVVSYLV